MSEYVMKDNSGSLLSNLNKDKDSQPDYRGEVLVNGKKMSLSAWKKQGKKGEFLSLSFQEPYVKPEEKQESKARPVNTSLNNDNFDNDIPF
jgi:uncharacterized protein (DUF736 family)